MVTQNKLKRTLKRMVLVLAFSWIAELSYSEIASAGALEQAAGMSGGSYGNVPDVGKPECVEGCDFEDADDSDSNSQSHSAPSGPSPEEQERRRVNAMNKANERGIKCFKQGDWDCAAKYFKVALQYSPYNPTLVKSLKRAEDARKHQPNSSGYEGIRVQSGQGFDTPGNQSGQIQRPAASYNPFQIYKEPKITSANRTPAIAALENIKTTLIKKRDDTETRISELQKDPVKNQQEITTVKKEMTELKNQENFLNFSIEVELKKAPDVNNAPRR